MTEGDSAGDSISYFFGYLDWFGQIVWNEMNKSSNTELEQNILITALFLTAITKFLFSRRMTGH